MTVDQAQGVARAIAAVAAILYRGGRNAVYAGSDWAAMRFIAEHESPTAQDIAEFHGVTKATMGTVISRLVDTDFVLREPHPSDGRAKILRLTKNGAKALKSDPLRFIARRLSHRFPVEDLDLMRSAIALLAETSSEWSRDNCAPCASGADHRCDASPKDGDDAGTEANSSVDGDESARDQAARLTVTALLHLSPCIDRAGSTIHLTRPLWNALRYFATVNRSAATLAAYEDHQALKHTAAYAAVTELIKRGCLEKLESRESSQHGRLVVTKSGRFMLRLDPNLKIANVLRREFDADALGRIGMVMYECLKTCATAQPQEDSPLQFS